MKIVVRTKSSWKIKFLDEVLSEMGMNAELVIFDVAEQPIGYEVVQARP